MKNSLMLLTLIISLCSSAQDIRDSLQGEFIGTRTHYKFGGIQEYRVPDTLYVYKATLAGKIHIRFEPYTTQQEYIDSETNNPQNLYGLEPDSSIQSQNYSYYQIGEFENEYSIYLYNHLRNGGGVADVYHCSKHKDISIGVIETIQSDFTLSPNPASDRITLGLNDNNIQRIEVYSIDGTLMHAKDISTSELIINVQDYKRGTYVVRAIGANGFRTKQFVKK